MPSECGVMSTSTAPTDSPAMMAAWMAAPIATHRSGLILVRRLAEPFFEQLGDHRRAGAAADQDDRSIWAAVRLASSSERCTQSIVRSISGRIRSSNSSRLISM